MRAFSLTTCQKRCYYLGSGASYPNKDEYSLGVKARSSMSPNLHILVSSQQQKDYNM